jgi:hypothetical protein
MPPAVWDVQDVPLSAPQRYDILHSMRPPGFQHHLRPVYSSPPLNVTSLGQCVQYTDVFTKQSCRNPGVHLIVSSFGGAGPKGKHGLGSGGRYKGTYTKG